GNEGNQSLWTLRAQGSGVGAGVGNPSNAELDNNITLSANTTYGIALVLSANHQHEYVNGNGTNEHYENDDVALDLGSAMNEPWTGSAFSPRVFNGSVYYDVNGGCDPIGGDDCGQGDDSNGFENGFNITAGSQFRNADDFIVSAGNTMNIRFLVLYVLCYVG